MACSWPVWFYFSYVHCANILKDSFNFSTEQIINHNFIISISEMIGIFLLVYLSSKIHPFKILKAKLLIFWIFVLICPYLLYNIHSPYSLMIMQCLVMFFALSSAPLSPIIGKQFTVFKRFTYISFSPYAKLAKDA